MAALLIFFSIAILGVLSRGNAWAGARSDYENFYLSLIYFFSENYSLPKLEDYVVVTFPFWPILGGFIFRVFNSESAVILLQIITGYASTCLVYFFSTRVGYSIRNSIYFALAFSSSIYVTSGSLNATTDVPAYCLILLSLFTIHRVETSGATWKEYALLGITLFLLIGTRQLFLWFVVMVYALEINRLGVTSFLRKYWVSVGANTLITLYFFNYFGNSLIPKPTVSSFGLSFPAIVNLGVISFIAIMFLLPFLLYQISLIARSKTFLISSVLVLTTQLLFLKDSILPVSQLSKYQYGWPNVWLNFGDFGYIFPAVSNSIFFGYLIYAFNMKYLKAITKFYFLGLISSALIISQPFTRYFEIPILIGLILLLQDCKLAKTPRYLNVCVAYIFIFEVTKTVITIL